jgi:hypothetical protein
VTTVLDDHVLPFARWPYEPFSREAAVQIALREWHAFGQQVVLPNTELPEDEERGEVVAAGRRILVARTRPALAATGLDRDSQRERPSFSRERRR